MSECFVAVVPYIRFLASVSSYMSGQVGRLRKSLMTHSAGKWSVSSVSSFVAIQVGRLGKGQRAKGGGKWFVSTIFSPV